jgi:SAM dependent carboxyl methyltransferase
MVTSSVLTTTSARNHGVMEGNGAYNRGARIPSSGAVASLPFLETAIRDMKLDRGAEPIVIADYGCSQGKNSLAPMRVAIDRLREKVAADRPILVFHVDQPDNDFSTLFKVLDTDPERYVLNGPDVFSCAIGKSFYKSVFPQQYVHLAWSSYAAVWLSRIPGPITGHFMATHSRGEERAAFECQAAQDWKDFLSLRARELRRGGRLVVVLPGLDDDGVSGIEPLMQGANAALAEMVDDGAIRAEERKRMVLGSYPRRRAELLAPFGKDGHFHGLTVECCELTWLPDGAWAEFELDHDAEALAAKHALFFRAVFAPSLALSLTEVNGSDRYRTFADDLERRLKRRLMEQPTPLHAWVQTMVVAREDSL